MPLNATWSYTAFVSPGQIPWEIVVIGAVTFTSFLVTLGYVGWWTITDCRRSGQLCDEEKRPIVPVHMELVRTIVATPAIITSMAAVCIFRPATAFVLELLMAIFSCVVVGCMTRYFLALLGEPPMPQELLRRVPKKRWWCGYFCGGVNDTLPGMGLTWSKVPHRVTLKDVRRGTSMVRIFMFLFIGSNSVQLSVGMIPTDVEQTPDGWCTSDQAISSALVSGLLIFFAVWASFIGMAGFNVIAAALSSVLDIELAETNGDEQKLIAHFKIGSQSKTAAVYMLLPLTLPILASLPIGFKSVYVAIPKVSHSHMEGSDGFLAKGNMIYCPVYDREVCGHMLYCMFVALGMMFVA
ncbi:unnamed protein product, partial [Effrenium voratum]